MRRLAAAACVLLSGCTLEPRAESVRKLGAQPSWLFQGDVCPAHAMPSSPRTFTWAEDLCDGSKLAGCLRQCQQGDGGACYSAALSIQMTNEAPGADDALFLHACRLGFTGGCTNAAAGRLERTRVDGGPVVFDECTRVSFERACDADDPWGCVMLATAHVEGKGAMRDPARARAKVEAACRLAPESEPCSAGHGLLLLLDSAQTTAR